jgi:hypothetical protein
LTPIRSFFARFQSAHVVCTTNFENIFACADVASARAVDAKLNARARKCFVAPRQQQNTILAKSPYYIELFAIFEFCICNVLRVRRARCRAVRARR